MGMAGGLLLPGHIRRADIRAEGRRRGFAGEDLDDFVEIVKALDAHFVQAMRSRIYAEFKASLPKGK